MMSPLMDLTSVLCLLRRVQGVDKTVRQSWILTIKKDVPQPWIKMFLCRAPLKTLQSSSGFAILVAYTTNLKKVTPLSLQTNIIFLCGDFVHVFHQALTRAFKANKIPVTIEQFSILAVLFYQNGINQKELGTLLGRDKTTITRIISNMVKSKLIRRVSNKHDGRGKLIYLAGKG